MTFEQRKALVKSYLGKTPVGLDFTKEKIEQAINFQEQYYETYIEII